MQQTLRTHPNDSATPGASRASNSKLSIYRPPCRLKNTPNPPGHQTVTMKPNTVRSDGGHATARISTRTGLGDAVYAGEP